MIGSAESKRGDASENELHPCHDWHSLANEAMCLDHDLPYLPVDTLFEMEFQVDTHGDLRDQHEHDIGNELGVNVLSELSALVLVAEEVSDDGEEGADCLYGNVPFRPDYLELCQMLKLSPSVVCDMISYT